MTKKSNTARQLRVVLAVAAVALLLAFRMMTGGKTEQPDKSTDSQTGRAAEQQAAKGSAFGENMKREFASAAKKALYNMFMPCALTGDPEKGGVLWILEGQMESFLPLYGYLMDGAEEYENGEVSMREILLAEAEGEYFTENTQGGTAGTGQNMQEGTLEVILVPQGSMAEMIRAGGAGLGGVLTPTGVGTIIEESPLCLGKQTINGKDYLLMAPLHADIAVVAAYTVDTFGNMWFKGDTRNFNTVMATAADTVIVECEELVELGGIDPNNVVVSGAYVDYIVEGGKY